MAFKAGGSKLPFLTLRLPGMSNFFRELHELAELLRQFVKLSGGLQRPQHPVRTSGTVGRVFISRSGHLEPALVNFARLGRVDMYVAIGVRVPRPGDAHRLVPAMH